MIVTSKTKYEASEAEIRKLFSFHKLGNAVDIVALGCGEFNAAYKVSCDNGVSYALKIAPPEGSNVLSYDFLLLFHFVVAPLYLLFYRS